MARYVAVDTATKKILGGPYEWNGETEWTAPEGGTLMLQSQAISEGYTQDPVEPTPEEILKGQAAKALDLNKQYLALNNPTNAQVVAQVRRLTQECSHLIRLAVQSFDEAEDPPSFAGR